MLSDIITGQRSNMTQQQHALNRENYGFREDVDDQHFKMVTGFDLWFASDTESFRNPKQKLTARFGKYSCQ